MIASFRDKEAATIWEGRRSRRLPGDIQVAALRKLRLLNAAQSLADLRVPPANRLEALKRRPQRAARDPHQRSVAHLFHLERGPCPRSRNRRLPLSCSQTPIRATS
jgi:proteic killer suppression protein